MATAIINGDAYTPLKVIIIGAGIGGLSAASFIRQQGHDVEVVHPTFLKCWTVH